MATDTATIDYTIPPGVTRDTAGTAHRVDGNIYISGYLIAADPEFIHKKGITRVVKMFADDPTYQGGYHRHDNVKYLVVPADDVASYDIRGGAENAIRFIQEGLENNEQILVHCHAGISRSSTVVLLHLMINRGMPLDLALDKLRRIRPIVNPNPGFMQHLRATEARLRRLRRTAAARNAAAGTMATFTGQAPARGRQPMPPQPMQLLAVSSATIDQARAAQALAARANQTRVEANDLSLLLRISRGESGNAGGKSSSAEPAVAAMPAAVAATRAPAQKKSTAWTFREAGGSATS